MQEWRPLWPPFFNTTSNSFLSTLPDNQIRKMAKTAAGGVCIVTFDTVIVEKSMMGGQVPSWQVTPPQGKPPDISWYPV
jgi:hypothetical protein